MAHQLSTPVWCVDQCVIGQCVAPAPSQCALCWWQRSVGSQPAVRCDHKSQATDITPKNNNNTLTEAAELLRLL